MKDDGFVGSLRRRIRTHRNENENEDVECGMGLCDERLGREGDARRGFEERAPASTSSLAQSHLLLQSAGAFTKNFTNSALFGLAQELSIAA